MRILRICFLIIILHSIFSLNKAKRKGINRCRFEICVGLIGFFATVIIETVLQIGKGITLEYALLLFLYFFIAILVLAIYDSLLKIKCSGNVPEGIKGISMRTYLLLIVGLVGSSITLLAYYSL